MSGGYRKVDWDEYRMLVTKLPEQSAVLAKMRARIAEIEADIAHNKELAHKEEQS